MKKYTYNLPREYDRNLVKWDSEKGLEELDCAWGTIAPQSFHFDTLEELKELLEEGFYSVDFNNQGDIIFVRWYETEDDCPVKIDESDSDWKDFCDGKIALWENSISIEPCDIYLNQTVNSFDDIQP